MQYAMAERGVLKIFLKYFEVEKYTCFSVAYDGSLQSSSLLMEGICRGICPDFPEIGRAVRVGRTDCF